MSDGATKIERPAMGARIKSSHRLRRGTSYPAHVSGWLKRWERIDWKDGDYEGIFIGWRTFSNGDVSAPDYGCGYTPTEHFEAWLIVPDERSAPIPVLPSDARVEA